MKEVKKIKVAPYYRVSTDEQKDNKTIENQKIELEKFIKEYGYEVYDSYLDEGISGTVPFEKRPGGKRLLKDAERKKFDLVLVLKTDRLGRSLKVMLDAVDTLSRLKINFKSISEPYNTQEPEGRMMFSIISTFSEYDWNNIQKNSMRGKQRAINEGRWIGGLAPYGYILSKKTRKLELYNKKTLLGKYSEVDVIKMIFNWCVNSKMTCEKIAERLRDMKIPTYTPGKANIKRERAEYWIAERVRNLLSDEVYTGEKIIGKRSKNKNKKIMIVPSFVSKDVWNMAQKVKKDNGFLSKRNAVRHYLLTGKIKCGKCGRNFSGLAYREYTYYACNNYRLRNNKHPKKCKNKPIRADGLESVVWDDISGFIKDPDKIKAFLGEALSNISQVDILSKLQEIENKLLSIRWQIKKLIKFITASDNYIEKDIMVEIEQMKQKEEKLVKEKEHYEDIKKKEEFEKRKISEIEKVTSLFVDKIDNADLDLKKMIVSIMVDKIIVYPFNESEDARKVEIYYKFNKKDPYIKKLSSIGLW